MLQDRFRVFLKKIIYKEKNGPSKIRKEKFNKKSVMITLPNSYHKSSDSGPINFSNCHVISHWSCEFLAPCLVCPWIFCKWRYNVSDLSRDLIRPPHDGHANLWMGVLCVISPP